MPADEDELDRLSRTYLGHPGFLGGDVAINAVLSDGRQLVLFGDTLREATYPGGGFARNSMMILDASVACAISGPVGGAIISDREDGIGYWPMSIVVRPGVDADEVAVMVQRIATTSLDDLGFVVLGSSVARFRIPHGGLPTQPVVTDLGPDDPSRDSVIWGAAIGFESGMARQGWIHVYGTAASENPAVYGRSLQVARCRWGALADPDSWEYWNGERWQSDPNVATELILAEGGVAQVLSVFFQEDRWFAVSTHDGDLGDEVAVWSAPSPAGPFAAHPSPMSLPMEDFEGALTYLVLAHPGLFAEPGSVVISYSRGSTDWESLVAHPLRYRPGFERIDLPLS